MVEIVDFEIEELDSFDDEYVYDLGMEDHEKPWFFANDILVHNSLYLSLKFVEGYGVKLKDGESISEDFLKVCDHFENYLNDNMNKWAIKELRSKDPRFVYKRESICDSSLFISGKNYILHMLNYEGVDIDKFKYVGNSIGVTSTEFPRKLKPLLKEIIHKIILSGDRNECNDIFFDYFRQFNEMEPHDIAKIKGMKGYEDYARKCDGLNTVKGMPNHVKAAYYHNFVMDKEGLSGKYEHLKTGDKIKILYIKKPNKYNIECIAFAEKWPKEFDSLFAVDFGKMFDKTLYSYVQRFYETVGWKLRKPSENLTVELDDLFGE